MNESFIVVRNNQGGVIVQNAHEQSGLSIANTATQEFQALANAGLLFVEVVEPRFGLLNCTITGDAYAAADSNPETGVGRADARFEALVTLAAEGRALKDNDNPVRADSAFDYWVHQVTEHLKDKFSSALAIEWHVDRAKAFYEKLGFRLDIDYVANEKFRVIQFTPPNSEASIIFGKGIMSATSGSSDSLVLAVDDIDAARGDLIARGVNVSEVFHYAGGPFNNAVKNPRVDGRDPRGRSY